MAIPRIVHRCWFGSKKMPDRYREYGRRWESFGYEVRDWTEATLPELVNARVWDDIGEHGANPGGGIAEVADAVQRADLASYELEWENLQIRYTRIDHMAPAQLDGSSSDRPRGCKTRYNARNHEHATRLVVSGFCLPPI